MQTIRRWRRREWREEVVTTYHCSKEAYFRCPNKQYCGTQEEAEFVEGSECAEFNRKQVRMGELAPERQVVYCSQCKHRATNIEAKEGVVFCTYWGDRIGCGLARMESDDFCSYGEMEGKP